MTEYKWIDKFGLKVHLDPVPHVKREDLVKILKQKDIEKQFNEYYGCQTQYSCGPYPYDVEAVFVKIIEGKKIGTQLHWD